MGDLVAHWAVNHAGFIEGLILGYASTHLPQLAGLVFHQAMRIPWLRAAIVANPARAKGIIEEISKELENDIDEEAAQPPAKQ